MTQLEIEANLREYFSLNGTDEIQPTTVCEANQCAIRGKLIQKDSQLKKDRRAKTSDLLTIIQQLKSRHKQTLAGAD